VAVGNSRSRHPPSIAAPRVPAAGKCKLSWTTCLETMLVMNGYELTGSIDEQESIVLAVASGDLDRAGFTEWIAAHVQPLGDIDQD
jgi:hypothetical protein